MTLAQPEQPVDLVLFGARGDLVRRKLLPALYQLEKANAIATDTRIVGVTRGEYSREEYVSLVHDSLSEFMKEVIDEEVWRRFSSRLHHIRIDLSILSDYDQFKDFLDHERRIMVNYLAVPPSVFGDISHGLHASGSITSTTRVVVEKPIGHDLESSRITNDAVAQFFDESQIYRIDHYLGKETVLNLLSLRFANSLLTTNWDHNTIDHVQITVAEEVGIEGRWGYFDQAGQMRDMIQNHLLQVLSLIAMEPPADLDAASIRTEKLKVLKALRPITARDASDKTVRGQYGRGFLRGQAVPGYLEEEGANENSDTETFVAIRADIDNWRWSGVPFYLRTGKRMPGKLSEIVIQFKELPHHIFSNYENVPANKLTIRLQPDEGVELKMMNKVPGLDARMKLQQTTLDLSFSETFKDERIADAYERLLLEAMMGNQTLFVCREEVEEAWKWVDGIIDAWQLNNEGPKSYQAGSWGPCAAIGLITKDGRSWNE
ncbi:glucose-6-phosphate dehydrogenase [Corallincola platygyrae]|uniref:Glucose-6-phosphate 1-dehydrogenase n=1 Tax=Corallincola platygyrae TaxID=1193278 RepID=A0ABW4XIK3_9GAMM